MSSPAAGPLLPVPRSSDRTLAGRDPYGWAFVLILASILVDAAFGDRPLGGVAALALNGATLLIILWASQAGRRAWRISGVIVLLAVLGGAISAMIEGSTAEAGAVLVALALTLVAQAVIVRSIRSARSITVHLILGALCVYLLIGVLYGYIYPLLALAQGTPFYVESPDPIRSDYLYFSYVTLTTVGYGDLTAATSLGRMVAISEALLGQLYLVSAVALLVGNIGRDRGPRGAREGGEGT